MPLVQIYVSQANNNKFIDVPLFGTYDVNVLNVSYQDNPQIRRPMLITSDILRCPNSSLPGIMFINNAHTNMTYTGGMERGLSFPNCDFNGRILINLTDITTGIEPVGFEYLLITLEVSKK